ncbi:hypothetical protein H4684_004112 [Desulfomicrobium macestii]|uniref:Uncharacterized protein n=1 Tax=Desulfomicrobium macestii TaxID=90731 RepID=A0ABR9H9R4_9BACT|nr:hypothetical protein [Desulfomicrobium macestii]MBE1427415.1 hypothetical protein [Desulfomicrobium macestii]
MFPSLYAKGKEELNRLEGLLATKEQALTDVGAKLEKLADILLERPDSVTMLDRLDALERQKGELSTEVEELRFQITEEQERIAGAGKAYGEIEDALELFIKIERQVLALEKEHLHNEDTPKELLTAREEQLTARRRVFQLLQKSIEKIVFSPSLYDWEDGRRYIRIFFKGFGEDSSLLVVVRGKGQKDSLGYVGGFKPSAPHVTLVNESWPPQGRILSGKALGRMLFHRKSPSE